MTIPTYYKDIATGNVYHIDEIMDEASWENLDDALTEDGLPNPAYYSPLDDEEGERLWDATFISGEI